MPIKTFKLLLRADALVATLALDMLAVPASRAIGADAPKPGAVYPLVPGMYVAEGSDCASAANAALRQYNGKGIASAHTHACKVTIRSRVGKAYIVDQSRIDVGDGAGPRFSERQTIQVRDVRTFVQTVGTDVTTYHICPAP
jgi:hypothetical protein